MLYFDRYTRLLAPDLDILADERLMSNQPAASEAEDKRPPVTVEVEVS